MIALCHLWPIWLIGWIAATIHSKRSREDLVRINTAQRQESTWRVCVPHKTPKTTRHYSKGKHDMTEWESRIFLYYSEHLEEVLVKPLGKDTYLVIFIVRNTRDVFGGLVQRRLDTFLDTLIHGLTQESEEEIASRVMITRDMTERDVSASLTSKPYRCYAC